MVTVMIVLTCMVMNGTRKQAARGQPRSEAVGHTERCAAQDGQTRARASKQPRETDEHGKTKHKTQQSKHKPQAQNRTKTKGDE